MKWIAVNTSAKDLNALPASPGVYMFMEGTKAIYIGKSVNLKARLKSHLQNAKLDPKEQAIWNATTSIRFALTDSDFKALLLEAKLIKKHAPQYNVIAKDDKTYLYIVINLKDDFPKVNLARGHDLRSVNCSLTTNRCFGPFPSTEVTQELLRAIRKLVPFCTSKRIGKRACFYSHIGLCNPCPNTIASLADEPRARILKRQYRKQIRDLIKILEGKTELVIDALTRRMDRLSEQQRYEEALTVRNKIENFGRWIDTHAFSDTRVIRYNQSEARMLSLKALLEDHGLVLKPLHRIECYDASTMLLQHSTASLVVATDGTLDKSQYRKFKIKNPRIRSDTGMLKEALKRRMKNSWPARQHSKYAAWPIPDLIVIDGGKPQVRAAREVLDTSQHAIPLIGIAKAPDRLILGIKHLPTIKPDTTHPGFNLVKLLRDESHRFARSYHEKLRTNRHTIK